jgi:hypothetical protein
MALQRWAGMHRCMADGINGMQRNGMQCCGM